MAARDDSVIRGSLIACLIFLVLSLALNFFLYRWGDSLSIEAEKAKDSLTARDDTIRQFEKQSLVYKAMLGVGQISEEQFNGMQNSESGDTDMDTIANSYVKAMSFFDKDFPVENRSYPALPNYLINAIRTRNGQLKAEREKVKNIGIKTDEEIALARKLQAMAEREKDDFQTTLANEQQKFTEERVRINKEKEEARDKMRQTSIRLGTVQKKADQVEAALKNERVQLQQTIETQRLSLNDLRSDKFESTQGLIRYVMRGRDVVTINLGSADALRPGVTFGVIDAMETRLDDAKVKASIQVTRIRDLHLAEARIVAHPSIDTPIIEGDRIFSPFWAPGRRVKIALAGDIDIDGDGRPDNQELVGMVQAAGAVVAAQISPEGAVEGKLDATIRFLVVGTPPEVSVRGDAETAAQEAQLTRTLGTIKQRARELGLTVIPAWKLQAYLKTINDSLTTPLGTAASAEDFPATTSAITNNRLPTNNLPSLYLNDNEGEQKGNKVLPP